MSLHSSSSAGAASSHIQIGCVCSVHVSSRYCSASASLAPTSSLSCSSITHEHAKKDGACLTGTLLEVRRLWRPPRTTAWRASLQAAHRDTKEANDARASTSTNLLHETGSYSVGPVRPRVMIVDHDHPMAPTGALATETKNDTLARHSASTARGPASVKDQAGTSLTSSSTETYAERLYGFVRVKDRDHRCSGWFPLDTISCTDTPSATASSCLVPSRTLTTDGRAAPHSSDTMLSLMYREITAGMARTQRAEKQLDHLEERLVRDCRCPTTIRYFVYLDTYIFAPWYYAPYGLLHPEYDPLSYEAEMPMCGTSTPTSSEPLRVNPYIRDAYLCPFSLRVYSTYDQMRYETQTYRRHGRLGPPGVEIYRDTEKHFSLFEINGSQHLTYCRHLFLLGKSFLENKLAGHDVNNYYFYVFCLHHTHFPFYINDTQALYFAGYFTWEKQVMESNLACIMTLPCFSHATHAHSSSVAGGSTVPRGIGQFMIAVSYELAYRRRQIGSPERPLSDLGALTYDRYWRRLLLRWMWHKAQEIEGGVPHMHSYSTTSAAAAAGCTSSSLSTVVRTANQEGGVVHERDVNRAESTYRDEGGRVAGMKCARATWSSDSSDRQGAPHTREHSPPHRRTERTTHETHPHGRSDGCVDVYVIDDSDEGEHGMTEAKSQSATWRRYRARPFVGGDTSSPIHSAREAGGEGGGVSGNPAVVVVVDSSDSQESEFAVPSRGPPRGGSAAVTTTRSMTSMAVRPTSSMPAAPAPIAIEPGRNDSHLPSTACPPPPPQPHASAPLGEEQQQLTIRQIAKEVGLEEADVMHTILTMGFLHRNAENRTLRFVIPKHYVEWECRRMEQRERSAHNAFFDPALLTRSGGAMSHATQPDTQGHA